MLHFGIIIISRNEGGHAIFKRQFGSSIEDLKTMINDIILLLLDEYKNHLIAFDEIKIRYSFDLRKSIYQQIILYVTLFVVRKIETQYQLLTRDSIVIFVCIEVFFLSMNLFCNYRIQECLYKDEFLILKDIHSH